MTDSYAHPDTVVPVDCLIVIDVQEWYDEKNPLSAEAAGILIHQYTDREYGTYNLAILQEVEVRPGGVAFVNKGILVPDICQDAFGPANTSTYLGFSVGQYSLEFRVREHVDTYNLVVSDSTLELVPIDTLWTRSDHRLLWRTRTNSIAVYCETNDSALGICQEFVDSLTKTVDLQEFTYPDSGTTTYKRASDGNAKTNSARFFTYGNGEDFARIADFHRRFVLKRIGDRPGSRIWIRNWKGEELLSWMILGESTVPLNRELSNPLRR